MKNKLHGFNGNKELKNLLMKKDFKMPPLKSWEKVLLEVVFELNREYYEATEFKKAIEKIFREEQ